MKRYNHVVSITKLAKLAGISSKIIRFYDKCGFLKTRRDPESNYHCQEQAEVEQLQKIMFFKFFDLSLEKIKQVMAGSQDEQF